MNPQRKRNAILLGVVALLAIGAAWNYSRTRAGNPVPVRRDMSDFQVTWRCLACGGTAEDAGGNGPRPCPGCGKDEMYVSIPASCPEHGEFLVAYKYDERSRPSEVKVADQPWAKYVDMDARTTGMSCPKCGKVLIPADTGTSLGGEEGTTDEE
jgi:predicted RNA-binding Zn-ribbon protein involved in translation (DUF1610 family)